MNNIKLMQRTHKETVHINKKENLMFEMVQLYNLIIYTRNTNGQRKYLKNAKIHENKSESK